MKSVLSVGSCYRVTSVGTLHVKF